MVIDRRNFICPDTNILIILSAEQRKEKEVEFHV